MATAKVPFRLEETTFPLPDISFTYKILRFKCNYKDLSDFYVWEDFKTIFEQQWPKILIDFLINGSTEVRKKADMKNAV